MFKLAEQLEKDTALVGELSLCQVLLMNDAQYPWVILVPKRADKVELLDLSDEDYLQYCLESKQVCRVMQTIYQPDKLNVAAIGNVVSQLHIHHVARYNKDATWPAPVWGKLPPKAYSDSEQQEHLVKLRQALNIKEA